MDITGKLKQDLIQGKIVLFLGAGASQAAGLLGATGLAEYLFSAAGSPPKYEEWKNDLAGLVARFDDDPFFTRVWVNQQLIAYFLNKGNYSNLKLHKTLLKLPLAGIFTTNYDSCLEYVDEEPDQRAELLPIVDSFRKDELFHPPANCLQYFKIHGSCLELRNHPTYAPPLIITRKDFRENVTRRHNFYERLGDLSWECSIVFIGFQAQREESDHLVGSVEEVYNSLMDSLHMHFRPFAVLPHLIDRKKQDLEDAGLTPLEGSFEDFIDAAYEIIHSTGTHHDLSRRSAERSITFTVQGRKFHTSRGELEQYATQFACLYDGLREELRTTLADTPNTRIAEIWKANPSDALLAENYYIERDQFPHLVEALKNAIRKAADDKAAQVIWLAGKRGSGKSTVAHQLAWYAYSELEQPTIILTNDALYSVEPNRGVSIEVSGWDEPLIDKFLSLSYAHDPDTPTVIPIILADHVIHRANALEHLLHYLEEHKKPSILILTISDEELGITQDKDNWLGGPAARSIARLKHVFTGTLINIEHKLSDGEINRLFEVVARVNSRVISNHERLLRMAKDENDCDRDFLLILYTWFDSRFRRLEEIIADEIAILEQNDELKSLYLATAVFHQYHFQPRLALCAKAMGMSNETYSLLRHKPLFNALINVYQLGTDTLQAVGTTRHVEFSRRIVHQLMPEVDDQVDLMAKVLSHCSYADLDFARSFMTYAYDYVVWLTYDQVRKLKEATEVGFAKDYVLNHQFAAYLIRGNLNLDDARYYLDMAIAEYPDNPSIIHSIGNFYFRKYRELLPENPEGARQYFEAAREYFAKSRALQFGEEEHGYHTEIAMLTHRLEKEEEEQNIKAIIEAERQALLFEALRVVPKARQNRLREQLGNEKPFHELPNDEQELLKKQILSGDASYILLEYYGRSLLERQSFETWKALHTLINTYWVRASSDLSTAVVVCLLAKQAFIKNAQTRFELLQTYYDDAILYHESGINFVLLAEYARLLMVDAFVLERYQFLQSSVADLIELYRYKKPRFLGDEYILTDGYYRFNESDTDQLLSQFLHYPTSVWCSSQHAARFQSIAHISASRDDRYIKIVLDNVTGYFVRAPRQAIATRSSSVIVNFAVKYSPDGFFATDFST
jgi:GTPase SAR1 family protein